ncbi:MAG TPA: nitrogen fixation protein NifH [bacterium]|nr:nitrogen fixation protein NifH [bacterium]
MVKQTAIQSVILDWLLDEENPSVRYVTLTDLLGKSVKNVDVKKAKQAIMTTGTVPKILSKQLENGAWEDDYQFYRNKYKGTVWQLIILANLGADSQDERIKQAAEFILKHAQHQDSGGFSVDYAKTLNGGSSAYVIPCLTGNMVWSLIKLGFLSDKRVQRAIDWLAHYSRFDDGKDTKLTGWPYDKINMCFSRHSCFMGSMKTLKALAEIPEKKRTTQISSMIDTGVDFVLRHHVYRKSHNLSQTAKPGWTRFGFPRMYQDDVLEILEILLKLGVHDERMQEAIDLVKRKQQPDGTWLLDDTFNGRFQTNIEQKGKPSKWITLKALTVLQKWEETA